MICGIIGKGSIGIRHSRILINLNIKFYFLRRKTNSKVKKEITFKNRLINNIDFFIISNPSSLHLKTIKKVIAYDKPILVEKPFVTQNKIPKVIKNYKKIFVLYQMRFDPRINFIKKNLNNKNLIKANFIWKTFLPNWHKYEDYRKSYAARKILGGGAIFTMSHEIDTAIYILGEIKEVFVKKYKNKLKTDVEENIRIYFKHVSGHNSSIILDFTSKRKIRQFDFKIKNKIYFKWNFFEKKIKFKNKTITFNFNNDDIYKKQLKNIILHIKQKKYKSSRIHLSKILHTQKILNSCVVSMKKRKIIKII
jgi:predicted dehydrogenase